MSIETSVPNTSSESTSTASHEAATTSDATTKAQSSESASAAVIHHRYHRPAVDIFEGDNDYLLLTDLPGAKEEQLQLRVDGQRLELKVDAKSADDTAYARSFELPEDIELQSIDAELRHGRLEVRLPKREESRPRSIAVKVVH